MRAINLTSPPFRVAAIDFSWATPQNRRVNRSGCNVWSSENRSFKGHYHSDRLAPSSDLRISGTNRCFPVKSITLLRHTVLKLGNLSFKFAQKGLPSRAICFISKNPSKDKNDFLDYFETASLKASRLGAFVQILHQSIGNSKYGGRFAIIGKLRQMRLQQIHAAVCGRKIFEEIKFRLWVKIFCLKKRKFKFVDHDANLVANFRDDRNSLAHLKAAKWSCWHPGQVVVERSWRRTKLN